MAAPHCICDIMYCCTYQWLYCSGACVNMLVQVFSPRRASPGLIIGLVAYNTNVYKGGYNIPSILPREFKLGLVYMMCYRRSFYINVAIGRLLFSSLVTVRIGRMLRFFTNAVSPREEFVLGFGEIGTKSRNNSKSTIREIFTGLTVHDIAL